MQGSIGTMLHKKLHNISVTFLYCPVKGTHANLSVTHTADTDIYKEGTQKDIMRWCQSIYSFGQSRSTGSKQKQENIKVTTA